MWSLQAAHTATYIAGIYNVPVTGCAVYVSSVGQLGCTSASSVRFKTDIAPMPDLSAKLKQLRPMTFRYKSDQTGLLQYGLIAEEVAKVYPELVIRGAAGQIDGVRYEELAPMLLSEVQQQQTKLAEQSSQLQQESAAMREMQQQVAELKRANDSMQAAMKKLLAEDHEVAMR